MANLATEIIVVTGVVTFGNEWYQTKIVNWRIPVATVLIAAIFDGLARLDANAAAGMAVIAFVGAMTTEFNGNSAASTVSKLFPGQKVK